MDEESQLRGTARACPDFEALNKHCSASSVAMRILTTRAVDRETESVPGSVDRSENKNAT